MSTQTERPAVFVVPLVSMALAAGGLFAGCFGGGSDCEDIDDCFEGQRCVDNRCVERVGDGGPTGSDSDEEMRPADGDGETDSASPDDTGSGPGDTDSADTRPAEDTSGHDTDEARDTTATPDTEDTAGADDVDDDGGEDDCSKSCTGLGVELDEAACECRETNCKNEDTAGEPVDDDDDGEANCDDPDCEGLRCRDTCNCGSGPGQGYEASCSPDNEGGLVCDCDKSVICLRD